jgi:FkbM family methyltransferase
VRFVRDSFFSRAARALALRVLYRVERLGDPDPGTNGELAFLQGVCAEVAARGRELVLIDGGANAGDYLAAALQAAHDAGLPVSAHAFEPTSGAFRTLHARFADAAGVRLNNCALADADGEEAIFMDRDGSRLASLYKRDLRAERLSFDAAETVRARRLDGYLREHKVEHVDLLKLDVEGAEYRALRGLGEMLRPGLVDFVQFEYGGTNLDARVPLKALFDLFEDAGYAVGRILPRGLRVAAYAPWMDNYAYANYAALARPVYERLLAAA